MKNEYAGMRKSLEAIKEGMNFTYHYCLAIQRKNNAWGLCVKLLPRTNWAQPLPEHSIRTCHPLPSPLFDTEEKAKLFLHGDKDFYGINFPLVFKGEQLIGCIDDTGEDFVYRPINEILAVSINNTYMAYTELGALIKALEADECAVIDIH